MTKRGAWFFYWAPRGLGVAFIAFLSLFALDVFDAGAGFWRTAAALVIHLTPSLVLSGALIMAWRWEWVGTLAFGAGGGLYMVLVWGARVAPGTKLLWALTIAGPAWLIAALFLAGWVKRAELRPRR